MGVATPPPAASFVSCQQSPFPADRAWHLQEEGGSGNCFLPLRGELRVECVPPL